MDPLTELVDVIASDASSPRSTLDLVTRHLRYGTQDKGGAYGKNVGTSAVEAERNLHGILGLARFLARSGGRHWEALLPCLCEQVTLLVRSFKQAAHAVPLSGAYAPQYFKQLLDHLCQLTAARPETVRDVSAMLVQVVEAAVKMDNCGSDFEDVDPSDPSSSWQEHGLPLLRAFLVALGEVPLPIAGTDAEKVAGLVYTHWVASEGNPTSSQSSAATSPPRPGMDGHPVGQSAGSIAAGQDRGGSVIGEGAQDSGTKEGKIVNDERDVKDEKDVREKREARDGIVASQETEAEEAVSRRDGGLRQGRIQRQGLWATEKLEVAFRIFAWMLPKVREEGEPFPALGTLHTERFRKVAWELLQSMTGVLKGRRSSMMTPLEHCTRWEASARFRATSAAALVVCGSAMLEAHEGEAGGTTTTRATLALLMDAADASVSSRWRLFPPCEALFSALVSSAVRAVQAHSGPVAREVLVQLRQLLLVAASAASASKSRAGDKRTTHQWPDGDDVEPETGMVRAITAAAADLLQSEWELDAAGCQAFLLSLVSFVREAPEMEGRNPAKALAVRHTVITQVAKIIMAVKRQEAVVVVLPTFLDMLTEGDAARLGPTRLRMLHAVSQIAGLGFEDAYREVVVTLSAAYLEEIMASPTGSFNEGSNALVAVERQEVLPHAFLEIARELKVPALRQDYLMRLLKLCSDVGLVAEARSGKAGAAMLGRLLPAAAEACRGLVAAPDTNPLLLKFFRNLWFYIALYGLAPPIPGAKEVLPAALASRATKDSLSGASLRAVLGPYRWRDNSDWIEAVKAIAESTPPLVVASVKWLEDELELNALINPGSKRGSANERAAALQRGALASALAGRVDANAMLGISGVKATYLLAVAFLEIMRLEGRGGVVPISKVPHHEQAWDLPVDGNTSSLRCLFAYLETPNLKADVTKCLEGIIKSSFGALIRRLQSASGAAAEAERENAVAAHACFLLWMERHRDAAVVELSDSLLSQMKTEFPQVLWHPRCFDCVLSLILNPPRTPAAMDPATVQASRQALHRRVQDWIMSGLALAPVTTQALLQEKIRHMDLWKMSSASGALLSLLASLEADAAMADSTNSPATSTAAAAAAGEADSRPVNGVWAGFLSASLKSQCVGEIQGMRRMYTSLVRLSGEAPGAETARLAYPMAVGSTKLGAQALLPGLKELQVDGLDESSVDALLVAHFCSQLNHCLERAQAGDEVKTEVFRDLLLRAAALLLSRQVDGPRFWQSAALSRLLRLLCWSPVHLFTPGALQSGLFVWAWLVSAAPELGTPVLAELVDAWQWTQARGLGIFSAASSKQGERALLRPQLTPGVPEPLPKRDPTGEISAHRAWLGFLLDRFEVARRSSTLQLALFRRLLTSSLHSPTRLTHHPAAPGAVFSLLLLGLRYCQHEVQRGVVRPAVRLLRDRVHRAALAWFEQPPQWYDHRNTEVTRVEAATLDAFVKVLEESWDKRLTSSGEGVSPPTATTLTATVSTGSGPGSQRSTIPSPGQPHPVWGLEPNGAAHQERRRQLLVLLCQHETDRLEAWAEPLHLAAAVRVKQATTPDVRWLEHVQAAWAVSPRIAMSMVARWPTNPRGTAPSVVRSEVTSLVQANVPHLRHLVEALPFFVTPTAVNADSPILQELVFFPPCSITQALEFLTPAFKGHHRVMAYVLRVLQSYPPLPVTFFMPQLVQALRYDHGGLVQGYLLAAAQQNNIFAHRLIWQLQGEAAPPPGEATDPRQPANALWGIVGTVKQRVVDGFSPEARDVYRREFHLFDRITEISSKIKPYPKDQRKAMIKPCLEGINVEGMDCYLPTAPNKLVRDIRRDSGVALQSAAKAPFMLAFDVVDKEDPEERLQVQACIFKEGDDCRQDLLALQVIALLGDVFKAVHLDLYLFPYGVLATGYEAGIIELVPNTRSRNQMGEITDFGLYDMFQAEYGPVGSPSFELARHNFIVSSAGYAVASLLLQPKDRHNGNLLFDNEGRLVHIDFGFILGISPGGNLGFETAQFKLSHEMTQLLDPSGVLKSEPWYQFTSLCIKGYLAARNHMDGIISTVRLMEDSGLPCFALGNTVADLHKRFHPEMNEREAANFMNTVCEDAYNKWTTAGYDVIQYLQQDIQH